MFFYNTIGKSLRQVHQDCGSSLQGYSIFVLQNNEDTVGKFLEEDFSIGLILKKFPQYADSIVKYENDFFGTTVLRIENSIEISVY